MNDIERTLKEQIISLSKRKLNADNIDDTINLIDNLGFDSVQIIQMVTRLEDAFDITFEDEDLNIDTLSNYKDLKNLLINKKAR